MRVVLAMIACMALPASAAVVILYHHVSDTTPKSTSISPAAFEAQMDYLAKNNFTVVPLLELTEKLRKGEPLPVWDNVRKLLSTQNVSTHVNLIVLGSVPSLASSQLRMGVASLLDDPQRTVALEHLPGLGGHRGGLGARHHAPFRP